MEGIAKGNAFRMKGAALKAIWLVPLVDDGVRAEDNKSDSTVIGAIHSYVVDEDLKV